MEIIIGIALAAPVARSPLLHPALPCLRTPAWHYLPALESQRPDAFYAAVTAFGLALISDFLLARQWFFRLFGGLALIAVGLRIVFAAPPEVTTKPENESYLADYTTMLAITLANPLTILFFTIIIPGFGVVIGGKCMVTPAIFVAGVFIGEMGWWVFLCGTLGSMRSS